MLKSKVAPTSLYIMSSIPRRQEHARTLAHSRRPGLSPLSLRLAAQASSCLNETQDTSTHLHISRILVYSSRLRNTPYAVAEKALYALP